MPLSGNFLKNLMLRQIIKTLMKSRLLLFTLTLLLLAACKKDKPEYLDTYSSDVLKYVIHHDGSRINSYDQYINNQLKYVVTFQFGDSLVIKTTCTDSGEVVNKCVYRTGADGYAVSSVDSAFQDGSLSGLRYSTYNYESGYLLSRNIHYQETGSASGIDVLLTYAWENDNTIAAFTTQNSTTCSNAYDYNDIPNVLDIRTFSNGITGKISKNLIAHANWDNGCPSGPSQVPGFSDFTYTTNANGYVTSMTTCYTPPYHTDPEYIHRQFSTTTFTYQP